MPAIDSILPHLIRNIKVIEPLIAKKDKLILVSLSKQVTNGVFLTEKQANLLVKILNENISAVKLLVQDIDWIIFENSWSKSFRVVQSVRKISLSPENSSYFSVEFSFNTKLKEKFSKLFSLVDRQVIHSGAKYQFFLSERNIDLVVSTFLKNNFEIDQEILDLYREIKKIKKASGNPFEIFSTKNEKLKKIVENDVGPISKENVLLLQDRKIRHQYQIFEKNEENSLSAKIANRSSRRIYINPQEVTFLELVRSLKDLQRLPLLVVFEGHTPEKDKKTLKLVENSVTSLELGEEIGIYFRYNKNADKVYFNQEIAELGYNKNLGEQTVIAGISNNKLPKFMIKSGWKPQSVITFTNSFRANKASVYCTDVDLVVYYTNTQPLDKKIHALV